jgi:hypothetical protein
MNTPHDSVRSQLYTREREPHFYVALYATLDWGV